jgi:3-dehydroquinate dehydratase
MSRLVVVLNGPNLDLYGKRRTAHLIDQNKT